MVQPVPVEVRNRKFVGSGGASDVAWSGRHRAVTRFFDGLSAIFPPGERFFIRSVRRSKKRVKDAALLREIDAFCAQEAMHGREHERYNARAVAAGYPIDVIADEIDQLIKRIERVVPRAGSLAATCALEHYTAVFADLALRRPEVFSAARPEIAAMWRWHAAEETEHKAVAFDVYAETGAGYGVRASAMAIATAFFFGKLVEHQVRLMRIDGDLGSIDAWRALGRYLFVDPGGFDQVLFAAFDYLRPGFHPWQHDNRDLLDAWRRADAAD
ncbi:MAG TPA: metal-dependent hydrolase [Byssovorax sp.]|jgi:hypothetical protein